MNLCGVAEPPDLPISPPPPFSLILHVTSDPTYFLQRDLNIPDLESYFAKEDQDVATSFDSDFTQLKARYYQEKLGFTCVDEAVLAEQTKCYVVGVQWVLHYYYSGVPSWSW